MSSFFEIANRYVCSFAVALKPLVISLPSRRDYRVPQGHVFLSSPSTAHAAALTGLVRAVDWSTDQAAPVEGDKNLFERHRGQFFEIPFHDAKLAVAIVAYVEPAPPTVVSFERPAPSPPAPLTGFEY
jgi:hypothetical protein